jgi:hypothetical protein
MQAGYVCCAIFAPSWTLRRNWRNPQNDLLMIDNEAPNATRAASPRARQRRADGCVQVHDMEAKCLELAARATEPVFRKQFLKMARLLQTDAELLAKSRACIVDSERLLASIQDDSQSLQNILTSRHAPVTESERSLVTPPVELSTVPTEPVEVIRTRPENDSAAFSVLVVREGLRFRWTLNARGSDVLGRGTAETERQARIDALQAGMIYIDRAKGRASPGDDTSLH